LRMKFSFNNPSPAAKVYVSRKQHSPPAPSKHLNGWRGKP
jgi:hypothetical protein